MKSFHSKRTKINEEEEDVWNISNVIINCFPIEILFTSCQLFIFFCFFVVDLRNLFKRNDVEGFRPLAALEEMHIMRGGLGWSVLHIAARWCDDVTPFSNILVERGFDIEVVDKYGDTPLHVAVVNNHLLSVEYFLDNHPHMVEKRGWKNHTPYEFAKDCNKKEIIDIFEKK